MQGFMCRLGHLGKAHLSGLLVSRWLILGVSPSLHALDLRACCGRKSLFLYEANRPQRTRLFQKGRSSGSRLSVSTDGRPSGTELLGSVGKRWASEWL